MDPDRLRPRNRPVFSGFTNAEVSTLLILLSVMSSSSFLLTLPVRSLLLLSKWVFEEAYRIEFGFQFVCVWSLTDFLVEIFVVEAKCWSRYRFVVYGTSCLHFCRMMRQKMFNFFLAFRQQHGFLVSGFWFSMLGDFMVIVRLISAHLLGFVLACSVIYLI